MHSTMERLYKATAELLSVKGQTPLAVLLGETPQTVNNWETRGISQRGAMKAERRIGVNADWVLTGEGEMRSGASVEEQQPGKLSPAAAELGLLFDLIPAADRVRRAKAYNAATQAILDVLQGS